MTKDCPVAVLVRQRIQMLGKSNIEVSAEAGFDKPNIIAMIKTGTTKIPMERISGMAKALELDPVYLLKLCLSTYHPTMWQCLEPFYNTTLTMAETQLLAGLRERAQTPAISALSNRSQALLADFIGSLKQAA